MGWESSGVVGFDLGPLLQGQTRIAKLKSAYNSLIIGRRGLDNMLNRSAQTGPPNVRKRRPVSPPAGRSSHCTRQVACRTSFLSRQADVIASFSFGACTAGTNIWKLFYILFYVSLKKCWIVELCVSLPHIL